MDKGKCEMSSPEGWKLVPVELTAENGMKAALIGEFYVPFPERDEDGNEHIRKVNVPWTVIKQIHRAVVAAAPTPPAQEEARNDEREGIACFLEAIGQHDLAGQVFAGMTRPINEERRNAAISRGQQHRNEPPAQEDEPVAWMSKDGYITLYRQGDAILPLYTRPQSDELRKAAEEATGFLLAASMVAQFDQETRDTFRKHYGNLRAALERK
jgi:hypothetical protein